MTGNADHGHDAQESGSHAGHTHGVSKDAGRRFLSIALALIVGFMAVEVVVGALAGSLALIADAGHMLTDAAAIGLALVAMRLAARPAKGAFTYQTVASGGRWAVVVRDRTEPNHVGFVVVPGDGTLRVLCVQVPGRGFHAEGGFLPACA